MGIELTFEIEKDKTQECFEEIEKRVDIFLEEAKDLVSSQASLNSPVDTGALSRSFLTDSFVDKDKKVAYIGSHLEYAIWQEYGTGEYALKGNGRKGGWFYIGNDGIKHFTRGVHPQRMLHNAVESSKSMLTTRFKKTVGE